MDVLFHMILGMIISKQIFQNYSLVIIIASILPDLIGTSCNEVLKITHSLKKSFKNFFTNYMKYTRQMSFFGKTDRFLYKFMHSFTSWLIFSSIIFIFFRNLFIIASLAYLLHIIIDISTHDKQFTLELFYPFSKFQIEGRSWRQDWGIFLTYWAILILVILFLVF
ncbi:hypothetical protein KY331_00705 [Candidatus Woesearchaeota archaeon]|nr:hypothetical protein [Candidatus Woesearchaeota archaeon]